MRWGAIGSCMTLMSTLYSPVAIRSTLSWAVSSRWRDPKQRLAQNDTDHAGQGKSTMGQFHSPPHV